MKNTKQKSEFMVLGKERQEFYFFLVSK